jgi:hypothetical protein
MRKIRLKVPGMTGLVVQQADHVAARLVAKGDAEYADVPVSPAAAAPIETAEAAPAPETAEGQHAEPKRRPRRKAEHR